MPNTAKGARAERRALLRQAKRQASKVKADAAARRERNRLAIVGQHRRYFNLSVARLQELAEREVAKGKLKRVEEPHAPTESDGAHTPTREETEDLFRPEED
jgi:hypothetical protein